MFAFTCWMSGHSIKLEPGIKAEAGPDGGSVVLGRHGRLSNLAVLPFFRDNPPVVEMTGHGCTVLDAYPVDTLIDGHCVMTLAKPNVATPSMCMIRFEFGGTRPAAYRGKAIPKAGAPTLVGMATCTDNGRNWWGWESDSVWTMCPLDRMVVQLAGRSAEIKLVNQCPEWAWEGSLQ